MADHKEKKTIIALVIIGIILLLTSFIGIDNIVLILGALLLIFAGFLFVKHFMMKKKNGRK